jgi:cytochrome c556
MILRTACVTLAVALGFNAANAQNVIVERQNLMKRSGDMAKQGAQIARGNVPFDIAKTNEVFDTFIDKAEKLPKLFPADSKSGDTKALSAIWDKPAEWDAAIKKFGDDSRAAKANTKDLDSFKVNFSMTGRNCGSCHEGFRK